MTTDDPSARELLLLAAANRLMFATPSSIASFVRTEVNEIETGLAALAARKLVTRDGERVLEHVFAQTVGQYLNGQIAYVKAYHPELAQELWLKWRRVFQFDAEK